MLKSFIAKFYLITSVLAIGVFGHCGLTGQEPSDKSSKLRVPSEIRQAPNGLRTFHYWHVGVGGYRGGK